MKKYLLFFSFWISICFSIYAQPLTPEVIEIPMRDGKSLKADIYLPDTVGNYPVILIQTPYSRLLFRAGLPLGIKKNIHTSPYAFVIVDWRCFYGSAAACILNPNRGEDGYDVVEWIANQSWSNGKIGTWGPSALGKIQFQTARENPPSLDCIAPVVAASQTEYLEIYPGGVARTEYIEQLDGLGFGLSGIYYANPVKNIIWDITENSTFYPDQISVPTFMIGGWYDHNVKPSIDLFEALQNQSDPSVRNEHRLLMGPWVHGGTGPAFVGSSQQGELDYPMAAGWNDSLAMIFFDYWLRDSTNGWNLTPKVQYFQMGENIWQNSASWPPPGIFEQDFFFHKNGSIQSFSEESNEGQVSFNYNPNDPSPTHGGPTLNLQLTQGPLDQSATVENRDDAMIFTSDPLTKPLVIKGRPRLELFVSSDRIDTDFAVRLTHVYPDGRSMLLADGIQRMRFRNGYYAADTMMMTPGEIYSISIELPDIGHTFPTGHQVRTIITSSNYPRFNRNMNTGGEMYPNGNGDTLVNPLIAHNTIHLNSDHPSKVVFPVVDSVFTSIDVNEENPPMAIYPNPTEGQIRVNIPESFTGKVDILLIDLAGSIVLRKKGAESLSGELELDLSKLANGPYFLNIQQKRKGSLGEDFKAVRTKDL